MNESHALLLMTKGIVAGLLKEDQQKVEEAAQKIRDIRNEYGDYGLVALSLVTAEEGVKP